MTKLINFFQRHYDASLGQFILTSLLVTITFKESVDAQTDLPLSGNTLYDGIIELENNHLFIWNGTSWVDQGVYDSNDDVISESIPGSISSTGPQGPQGIPGPQGVQGQQGIQGTEGEQGPQGVQGEQGVQGLQGEQGLPGTQDLSVYLKNTQLDPNTLEYVAFPPDTYTKLLLHGNGTDESPTIIDEIGHTVFGAGTTQLDTSEKKFGTASIQFNKNKEGLSRTDYAYVDMGADSDLGNEDFTIDLWVKINAYGQYGNNPFISHDYHYWNTELNRGVSWGLMFQQEYPSAIGRLIMMRKNDSNDPLTEGRTSSQLTLDLNTWYHIAVVRDGNTLRFFVNGIQQGTADCTGISYDRFSGNTEPVYLGRSSGGGSGELPLNLDGWMDEVRVSKGIARWTENFMPPTVEHGLFLDAYMKVILDTDETLNANSDVKVPSQKAVKSYIDAVVIPTQDLKDITLNIMLNAFRIAQIGSLTIFNMVKGFVDEYENESGVDLVNSINELYNSMDDFYSPSPEGIDSYTMLLLSFNNTLDDTGAYPKSVSANNIAFSDTVKKWDYSCIFNGLNSHVAIHDSDDFAFGTGNWTIDFWVRFDVVNQIYMFISQRESTEGNSWYCAITPENKLCFTSYYPITGVTVADYIMTNAWIDLAPNTWYHLAFVRDGAGLKIFIDGISQTLTELTSFGTKDMGNMNQEVLIGCWNYINGWFDGYLDEFRISKGIARWTENFTPLSVPYVGSITGNMTLLSEVQTAEIIPTSARIVLFEEDVHSITTNTDLKAYVSRDNGTTFTQVNLEDEGDYITGARVLSGSVDISGQPSGSNIKYKIETLNNKNLKIHGTAISWK
jgi:Concanavalin A-like lectin/glucanases superfamily/Collagen triple helix repeat (20 copies)